MLKAQLPATIPGEREALAPSLSPVECMVIGLFMAMGCAFTWALLAYTHSGVYENWFPDIPLLAVSSVILTSWFVLPLGAVVGMILPGMVHGRTWYAAFFMGAFLGICVAVIAAVLTSVAVEWATISGKVRIVDHDTWWRTALRRFAFNFSTMSLVCGIWSGIWSACWSRRTWRVLLERED